MEQGESCTYVVTDAKIKSIPCDLAAVVNTQTGGSLQVDRFVYLSIQRLLKLEEPYSREQ